MSGAAVRTGRLGRLGRVAVLAAAACALGCATPIGVTHKSGDEVQRDLTRSALSSREPSSYSTQVLVRTGLRERFEEEPEEVLATLASLQGIGPQTRAFLLDVPGFVDDRLFALAELSFLHAERSGDRSHYRAAAVFAYAFLFSGKIAPEPFDPRLRLGADLYNRALAEGLWDDATGGLDLKAGDRSLPFGTLSIDFDDSQLQWAGYELGDFEPAANLAVRGLLNRYRRPGLGAPLVATAQPVSEGVEPVDTRVMASVRVPVTALLRIEDVLQEILQGRLRARLEILTLDRALDVEIEGRTVPLEYESSSAFAATLSNDLIWKFETRGFFRGDFLPFEEVSAGEGLFLLQPYAKGRIPIVFVHGTASSPGRWADLVNEVENVPVLRERYQPWLFMYNTGQPIAYSASLLRKALREAVSHFDPMGDDPALRQLVVIGHSQGGLLAKLLVTASGDRFWHLVSDEDLDALDLDPEARELLRQSLFWEPLPFVDRVVFLCTPHRGSYLAAWRVSYWLRRFIRLPGRVVGAAEQLISRNPKAVARRSLRGVPNSLDNMTAGNPFLMQLADTPIAPGVHAHSIIAVKTKGPVEEGNDGVVTWRSAHLDGVESEAVVQSGHSAQSNPETMREVGRILIQHLGLVR